MYTVGDTEYAYHDLTYAEDHPIEEVDLNKGESLSATIVYEITDEDAGTQGVLSYA